MLALTAFVGRRDLFGPRSDEVDVGYPAHTSPASAIRPPTRQPRPHGAAEGVGAEDFWLTQRARTSHFRSHRTSQESKFLMGVVYDCFQDGSCDLPSSVKVRHDCLLLCRPNDIMHIIAVSFLSFVVAFSGDVVSSG